MSTTERKSLEPWIKDDIDYMKFQIDGVRTLFRRKSFILADDMGLGKTLTALTVFGIDVKLGWSKTMIVVCPATLKGNWEDEIEKFTRFPCVVVDGDSDKKHRQMLEWTSIPGPKILVVNYEQVVHHLKILNNFKFDISVYDEAHFLQTPTSKRTEACLELYARRSFLLTGTPLLNHVDGLWALLNKVGAYDKGYYSYANRYLVFGGHRGKQIVGVKNEDELTERLQGFMLRRTKENELDLPEVQMIERAVDLHPEQKELYRRVAEDLKLDRFDLDNAEDVKSALVKFLRLKEICGSTYKFSGTDVSSKLDLAITDDLEILENGNRVVVFTQFLEMIECYAKRMNRANSDVPVWVLNGSVPKKDRQPMVKEWGATREPGVLVCQIKVAGVGLNMTQARHGAFLDKLFVPGLNQQAIDRLHRIGADEVQPVQFRDYKARNTIENRINAILRIKSKLFGDIIETDPEWMKKLLQSLLEDEDKL